MNKLILPWPDSQLSPNNRIDRRYKTSIRQAAREIGFYAVKEKKFELKAVPLALHLIFNPPNNKRRDLDNLYSSFKSTQDGIFEALGIDDCLICRVVLERGDIVEDGSVILEIGELNDPS